MVKAILGFTWDSFLIVWAMFLFTAFILTSVLMFHLGGYIDAGPVVVLMDHVVDGSIRWLSKIMFP